MNLGASLYWVSRKMGEKTCLIENKENVSYSFLWNRIELLAKAFLNLGLQKNDKVILFLPNCKEFIFSFYALARINVISVPLNHYLSCGELSFILKECSPKVVISTYQLYEKKLKNVLDKDSTLFLIDKPKEKIDGSYAFEELYECGKKAELPRFRTDSNQIASINYTYRGLGRPMGAILTHGNYHHGAIGYVRLTEFATSQCTIVTIPMSHIFTLVSCVIVPLLRGATIVIMRNFIPRHIFKAIEEYKVDFIISVPTVYNSLLKNFKKGKFNITTLKCGITGGSYLSLDMHKKIKEDMGIELFQGYGLTETMPISCNPKARNKPESLGIAGHEVEVQVVNEQGEKNQPNSIGEILIGGPTVMRGYFNNDEANKLYLKEGWFYTGDYGRIDNEGYIYFDSLKKNIAKIGGYAVDLKEVQETLSGHPGVIATKLNVTKDDLWGSLLNAEITLNNNSKSVTEKGLKSFCADRLALYKIPRNIIIKKEVARR